MTEQRLSRLQKYILYESGKGMQEQKIEYFYFYWIYEKIKNKGQETEKDIIKNIYDDFGNISRRTKQKYSIPLMRSLRNLEDKGLIHIGADKKTISLTERGSWLSKKLPDPFQEIKDKNKATIRPLKFRPPKVFCEFPDADEGFNQIKNRMEQIAKAFEWVINQIKQLDKDRIFWGNAVYYRALKKCWKLPSAIKNFQWMVQEFRIRNKDKKKVDNKGLIVSKKESEKEDKKE